MANALRDNNRVPTKIASDDAGSVEPLRVDPANNRLLLDVTVVTDAGYAGTWPTRTPRDNNRVPIAMAVTDDADETVTPLRIDNRNGLLFVDWFAE